jgi:hypothetical protein
MITPPVLRISKIPFGILFLPPIGAFLPNEGKYQVSLGLAQKFWSLGAVHHSLLLFGPKTRPDCYYDLAM